MNTSDRVSAGSLPSAGHHMLGSQADCACYFGHQEEFEFAEISFQIDAVSSLSDWLAPLDHLIG